MQQFSTQTIDIVILSYAKSDAHLKLTETCIASLLASEQGTDVVFKVVVVESNKKLAPFQFSGAQTIYPSEDFGYNRFLNVGISSGSAPYVCLCNNDLVFHENWATNMLAAFLTDTDLVSASPMCPEFHGKKGIRPDTGCYYGYKVQDQVAGWCLFVKRSLLDHLGPFDENFIFWYCDDDYAKLLKQGGHKHALVSSSQVTHFQELTSGTETQGRWHQLTDYQVHYFHYKWEHRNYFKYRISQAGSMLNFYFVQLKEGIKKILRSGLGRKG